MLMLQLCCKLWKLWIALAMLIIFLCRLPVVEGGRKSTEKRLLQSLMKTYSQTGALGRPINGSGHSHIVVEFGLALIQILDLDESRQVLRTNCWERWRWHDGLLQWNPQDYRNISQIRIHRDQVWTPDIHLFNFADERLKDRREARLVLSHNGNILWIPQALYKSSCNVDITYFPFDVQLCVLEFGSMSYDASRLDLVWWKNHNNEPSPYIDYSTFLPSNEWETDGQDEVNVPMHLKKKQLKALRGLKTQTYQAPDGSLITKSYPVLQFVVSLKRNASFYLFILVLPCVLLSVLTLIVFWLPPESPAKLLLGMNIFVSLFVLMLLLAECIPTAVETFPLLGIFFCVNMVLIALSIFLVALVINFYLRGERFGRMPRWMRKVLVDGLGRIFFVRQYTALPTIEVIESRRKTIPEVVVTSTLAPPATAPNSSYSLEMAANAQRFMGNTFSVPEDQQSSYSLEFSRNEANPKDNSRVQTGGSTKLKSGISTTSFTSTKGTPNKTPANNAASGSNGYAYVTLIRDIHEIKAFIGRFMDREIQSEKKSVDSREWRALAAVLDRLFFVCYVLILCVLLGAALYMYWHRHDPRMQAHSPVI